MVRQTISKLEKNLSVPNADVLIRWLKYWRNLLANGNYRFYEYFNCRFFSVLNVPGLNENTQDNQPAISNQTQTIEE
jgi:hypothetical protein